MTFLTNFLQNLSRHQDRLWRFAFVLVIAFFAAKTINLLLAHFYLPIEVPTEIRSSAPATTQSADPKISVQAILSRNIFDSEARKRTPIDPGKVVDGQLYPSTLNAELLGTIVFQHSKYSAALIKDRSTNKAEYYSVGENFQSARVTKIERFRTILENNGRLETLELKAAENKISGPNLFNEQPAPVAPGSSGVEFEEISPNNFRIPRGELDAVLNNFSKILTEARMVPNLTSDNKTDGFKVFQIKPGSIYKRLGLRDNDIIKRVNGQDLDGIEKATGLFTALRNEKTIAIDFVRDGTRISYTYEIP